ncbi:MAG TPA: DUF484 family protein [Thiobacillaceae bacterium]|nr:DUF484 family protein [Thiobacillaceae bacterium]
MDMPSVDIADYLKAHPDFFNQHAELLADLHIPHPHGTHAVSITERQILSLREKVRLLEGRLAHLIQFGEENDAISDKLHKLTVDLTGAVNIHALLAALESHLHEGFAVPHSAVRIWSLPANDDLAALQPVSDTLRAQVDAHRHPACGPLRYEEVLGWFGELAPHLRSFAAIPLRSDESCGLLVLASEDPKRFYPEMGVLYLERLGELLGAAISRMT